MNPRVSRSSALASKATGFPIAKLAAKVAVGYTLDELRTRSPAARPSQLRAGDRLRSPPRSHASRSEIPAADAPLTTQMKSVGEVMAIGRTFQESLHRRCAGWRPAGRARPDRPGPGRRGRPHHLRRELKEPGPERIFHLADAFRAGMSVEDVRAVVRGSVVPRPDRRTHRCRGGHRPPRAGWPRCEAPAR
ncbi:hypothetical protein [Thermomonas sp.]|uniref:ATP-binding protein n=1 Tax=Thermomonas sp. TaxID=1971895 RepID=UPI0025DE0167|nr:hypothetical protein [Thermomonas sp.]